MNNNTNLYINHRIQINTSTAICDGKLLYDFSALKTADIAPFIYRDLKIAYPKFFKMDGISRLGFIAVELLMQAVQQDFDKEKVALLFTSADGCREIDERFEESRNEIPSPALFVYTLPNIVAGEICIRNGFKGEQMVWIAEAFDEKMNAGYLQSLFSKGKTEAVICGFLNAYNDNFVCDLMWISDKDLGGKEHHFGS